MTTYRIIGYTNPWIAQRDSLFNGKTEITIKSGLTLAEARKTLLDLFCEDYDISAPNWGVAMNSKVGRCYASHCPDGTYSYWYDSRTFLIGEDEDDDNN